MVGKAWRPMRTRARSTLFLIPAWFAPASSLRAAFHRLRGVRIGHRVEIGYFVIIDNLYPEKGLIEDGATISARSTILAHEESKAYTSTGCTVVRRELAGTGALSSF